MGLLGSGKMKKDKLTIALIIISIAIMIAIAVLFYLNMKEKNNSKKVDNQLYQKEQKVNTETKETTKETKTLFTDQTPVNTEEELITYVEQIEQEVMELTNEKEVTPTIKEKLTNTFITLTDFIFYGGTIKGKTFQELSSSAKEKVLNALELIDTKIESIAPNYKENIKETAQKSYTTVKEKVTSLKDSIITSYKEKVGEDQYNQVVSTYQEDKTRLKNAYSPAIDKGKEVYEKAKEKSKEIYGTTKEKADAWYQEFKESRN